MSSSPVLVLDIDGVVSLAQPGSAQPWYATLQADWGFDHDEMARDFFRGEFLEVLRGRLDLYVALQAWLDTKGLADRLEEFVAYWFAKDAVIDRGVLAQADAWRQRTGGRCFAASNQEHHRVAYLRDEAGLGAHFDEIIYSAALGVCKPDRVFFTNAQARMGVTVAQSILFVDDTAANVDGARACGWRAMLYRGPESLERGRSRAGARLTRVAGSRSFAQMIACRIIHIGTSTVGTNDHGRCCMASEPGPGKTCSGEPAPTSRRGRWRRPGRACRRRSRVDRLVPRRIRASQSSGSATAPVMMSPQPAE